MADNRIARGIVLVPCLLLGGAFLATAAWGQGAAAENRTLAIGIGAGLLLAGWLSQLGGGSDGGPESSVTKPDESDPSPSFVGIGLLPSDPMSKPEWRRWPLPMQNPCRCPLTGASMRWVGWTLIRMRSFRFARPLISVAAGSVFD